MLNIPIYPLPKEEDLIEFLKENLPKEDMLQFMRECSKQAIEQRQSSWVMLFGDVWGDMKKGKWTPNL